MSKAVKSRQSLTNGPIGSILTQMTLPMILGMVMMFSFNLVDTFFISLLGTEALSAISFTFPLTFTVMSLAIGLSIGTSAVVAKYIGRGDEERAKEASTVTNYVAVLLAVIIATIGYFTMDQIFLAMGASEALLPTIREYMDIWLPTSPMLVAIICANSVLRANGDTRTPSLLMAAAGLVNAALDPILIFGFGPIPAMGVQGAALATTLSWIAGVAFLFYFLLIRHQLVSPTLPSRTVLLASSREMLRIGIPASGANMMTPLAAAVMTAIVASYGEEAVAAFGVGSRLESIACIVILALSSTLPPFISQNLGAEKPERIAEACRLSIRFVLLWQLLIYIVMAVGAPVISWMFTREESVANIIQTFIWILPLSYGMQGVIILCNSALNAMHHPMSALYLSAARFFIFYVPLAWLLGNWLGLTGVFAGAAIGNLLMAWVSWSTVKRAIHHESDAATQLQ